MTNGSAPAHELPVGAGGVVGASSQACGGHGGASVGSGSLSSTSGPVWSSKTSAVGAVAASSTSSSALDCELFVASLGGESSPPVAPVSLDVEPQAAVKRASAIITRPFILLAP